MAAERGLALECLCVPYPHGLVVAAAEHAAARMRQCAHRTRVALEDFKAVERGAIPHAHGAIVAAAEQAPIRNGERPHRVSVALQRLDALQRCHVPHLVGGGRQQHQG